MPVAYSARFPGPSEDLFSLAVPGTLNGTVCHYAMNDGAHLLADCPAPLELIAGSNAPAGKPSPVLTPLFASQTGSARRAFFGGFSGSGPYDPGGDDDQNDPDGNSLPSVPLPTPLILLLTAILGLRGLRR